MSGCRSIAVQGRWQAKTYAPGSSGILPFCALADAAPHLPDPADIRPSSVVVGRQVSSQFLGNLSHALPERPVHHLHPVHCCKTGKETIFPAHIVDEAMARCSSRLKIECLESSRFNGQVAKPPA